MGPSYLAAQAERGLNLYVSKCASCHGSSLQGGSATPLPAAPFQSRWANRALRDLLYVIATQMPLNAPGSLSDEEDFDLLAFILHKNEYPSGPATLYGRAQLAKPDDAELLRADDADLSVNPGVVLYRGALSGDSSRVTWGSTGAATIFIFAQGEST